MNLTEEVGESSSPPRTFGNSSISDLKNDVYNRLVESGNEEALFNPDFRQQLDAHFNRLPPSYGYDNMDRVEDFVLHMHLLAKATDPKQQPVYHIRFLEKLSAKPESSTEEQSATSLSTPRPFVNGDNEGVVPSQKRAKDCVADFEPCSKLEDLNLDVRKNSKGVEERSLAESFTERQKDVHIHEVIFSTIDKPKLLSQLSALLSDIGLNIREAHVFSTTDGYSLDVFVVDGWNSEGTDHFDKEMRNAIARSEGSWSRSSHSRSATDKAPVVPLRYGDQEIDIELLKTGEKIASGSCGHLYHGVYHGQDVAVKILRSEHLNDALQVEFAQEVAILRAVEHPNVVRFIGACTESTHLCILTEYMSGGSLYDYLHKNHNYLKLCELLKFALDICKGMEYLHQKNIIHRDLKTANLLMNSNNVVKVADFGVARFQNQGGVMTAETGTYRWMAPEVINHQPYDQKADVFSFAIVLWELVTAKIPYETMTPLQAALGVRQGMRPELPRNAHPKLLDLMQKCWETVPSKRPSFSEIIVELEELREEIQETSGSLTHETSEANGK
ncbi:hypothetical protein SLE2022_239970 [Rubroshorea leprosula]